MIIHHAQRPSAEEAMQHSFLIRIGIRRADEKTMFAEHVHLNN